MSSTDQIPLLPLNSGTSIPQLGLGTWPMDDDQAAEAVAAAADLGYRHFDTATAYGNEAGVAEGMRRTGIPREELFVTTKLDGEFQGDDRAIAGLDAALNRMRLDYVDLLLIHWPLPQRGQFVSTWRTFEKLLADGRTRAIGTSNFTAAHLTALAAETDVTPAVNQIQLTPYVPREEQRAYGEARGIRTSSWSPLGGEEGQVTRDPLIVEIANAHGRTAAQIVLRWHVQNGLIVIPKSANPARMAENAAIFDFELSADDLTQIATISHGPDAGVDSDRIGH
ncbi:aldo/keto reductase [Naasia lichenicola]|uniref:Aldo/keto reductase n=1 Tax=Naasia lichenicola TaxID=2565933 RepID=A0A4S4FRU3_9MICO|nr:aldo/keto reductase [Naasia lichenicola]THG33383.1 aldo/keto reductase [Naasia lichenicola]